MSDRVELKHLEMENQKYQFRYLRNQLNEKKLYRGDPRLLMYVYFHDGRKQVSIPIEISILFGNSEHPFPERKNMPFRSRVQPFI